MGEEIFIHHTDIIGIEYQKIWGVFDAICFKTFKKNYRFKISFKNLDEWNRFLNQLFSFKYLPQKITGFEQRKALELWLLNVTRPNLVKELAILYLFAWVPLLGIKLSSLFFDTPFLKWPFLQEITHALIVLWFIDYFIIIWFFVWKIMQGPFSLRLRYFYIVMVATIGFYILPGLYLFKRVELYPKGSKRKNGLYEKERQS